MVHPHLLCAGQACEQRVGAIFHFERGQAVFALLAFPHRSAERVRHDLLAVADSHHGPPQGEYGGVYRGAGRVVNAARAAGDDDALDMRQLGGRRFAETHFGVNA